MYFGRFLQKSQGLQVAAADLAAAENGECWHGKCLALRDVGRVAFSQMLAAEKMQWLSRHHQADLPPSMGMTEPVM